MLKTRLNKEYNKGTRCGGRANNNNNSKCNKCRRKPPNAPKPPRPPPIIHINTPAQAAFNIVKLVKLQNNQYSTLPWSVSRNTYRNIMDEKMLKKMPFLMWLRDIALMLKTTFDRNLKPGWVKQMIADPNYNGYNRQRANIFLGIQPDFMHLIKFGEYPGSELKNLKEMQSKRYTQRVRKEYLVLILLYEAMQSRVRDATVKDLLDTRGLGKPEFEQYKQLLKDAKNRDDLALWRLYMFFKQFHVERIRGAYERYIL